MTKNESHKQLQVQVERIWLQGEEALIPKAPVSKDYVQYKVPGLGASLEIKDHRAAGRSALQAACTKEGARNFHENFDSPALVTIHKHGNKMIVEIDEPVDSDAPTYDVLWVAALVEDPFPAWPMPWHLKSPLQGDRQSFIAILE